MEDGSWKTEVGRWEFEAGIQLKNMKTIKFNIILFAIILFYGCNSSNNNKEVLKKDFTEFIVKKSVFTKKNSLKIVIAKKILNLKIIFHVKKPFLVMVQKSTDNLIVILLGWFLKIKTSKKIFIV